MVPQTTNKRVLYKIGFITIILMLVFFILSRDILCKLGEFLILDKKPEKSDVVVVLNTDVEYYPRLIEAAAIYNKGVADKIVINGNRKTDILRALESKGFELCCHWCENRLRILSLLGVPRDSVICISAEDAYDTISEANSVGKELVRMGYSRILITTSKYHTRRASLIWEKQFGENFSISTVSAKTDPYDPHGWWKEGRQLRWVMAEYGAWIYYWWKRSTDTEGGL